MQMQHVLLIVLHSLSGHAITVNPQLITSMREGEGKGNYSDKANCLINLSDGKFVTVTESCEQVRAMVQQTKP